MAIRKFKPVTPGQRNKAISSFEEITAKKPQKSLLEPLKHTGGRNNTGQMTMRYIGGGHKRMYRVIDFLRDKDECTAKVLTIEYDPNRSARIALVQYEDGEKRYIIAPNGIKVGQTIASGQMIGRINVVNGHKMEADIDEHYIDRIATGLTGTMERGKSTYQVMVGKVYPDVRDSKFRIDMQFVGNVPANMRNGQTNYVNLRLGEPSTAIMIPRGSFFTTTGGNWIFVIGKDGKTAHRRSVRIGRQNPSFYEVTEGLQPGERVVIGGYDNFGDCTKLIIE